MEKCFYLKCLKAFLLEDRVGCIGAFRTFNGRMEGGHMIQIMYISLFLLSFVMLLILNMKFKDRVSVFYILLSCSILITNFGAMQMVISKNLQAAVFANQTVYLGGSFAPALSLLCIADLCKIRIRKVFSFFLLTYAGIIFLLISTVGSVTWYYKSMQLIQGAGFSFLKKVYGPAHIMFPIYLCTMVLISLGFIIRAFQKKKEVSYVTSILLLISISIMVIVYCTEKLAHLSVELIPAAYCFSEFIMLLILKRIRLYDIFAIREEAVSMNREHGFILCASNGKYLGSDDVAKQWFQELGELNIDRKIVTENTPLLQQIGKWIRNEDANEKILLESGGSFIEIKHAIVNERGNKIVHCIYLRDDTKQQTYAKMIEQYNENLEKDVEEKTEKLEQIQNDIIEGMACVVENRDSNTGGHVARTSDVVRIFVKYLLQKKVFKQFTPQMAGCIIKAAPLHDLGKIGVPDNILNKPGKFEPEEYEQMKTHSEKGAAIVGQLLQNTENVQFKSIAVNIAHYHHEKWDGNGYPTGIKGNNIPLEARIMALADVFDALVSKRVYKERFSYDKAFDIIEESGGSHFDPELCKAFLACRSKLEKLYDSYSS